MRRGEQTASWSHGSQLPRVPACAAAPTPACSPLFHRSLALQADAEEIAALELKKKRTFRKFTYRGIELDNLLDLTPDQLVRGLPPPVPEGDFGCRPGAHARARSRAD